MMKERDGRLCAGSGVYLAVQSLMSSSHPF